MTGSAESTRAFVSTIQRIVTFQVMSHPSLYPFVHVGRGRTLEQLAVVFAESHLGRPHGDSGNNDKCDINID
jgi:hypothetical protein